MGIKIFPLVAGYNSAKLCSYYSAKLGSYCSACRPNGPARRGTPILSDGHKDFSASCGI